MDSVSWEEVIDPEKVVLIRTKTNVWFGCGAIQKINDICDELNERGWKKVLVITGKNSYKTCGAWDVILKAFNEKKIDFELYSKILPNPLEENVIEATKIGVKFGAQVVLGIGGGSVIDSSKAIATMIKYPKNEVFDLYTTKKNFPNYKYIESLPIIAVNTTAGTGTEADRYSVVSFPEKQLKLGTGHENIYPMWSIDDCNLLKHLPLSQTLYTALDALNHANECATSIDKSPYSILTAKETIRLVCKYLPIAIKNPNDSKARYYLHYAALLAGVGIDNSGCHITHQLEHVLSAVDHSLPHGLGLSMILPAVELEIYPKVWKILIDIFEPILPKEMIWGKDLKKEAIEFAKIIENWIFSLGVKQKLTDFGFDKKIEEIFKLGCGMRAFNSPLEETEEEVRRIYENSFKKIE